MRTFRPRPDPYKSDRCQLILTKLRSTVHVMNRPAARQGSRPHPGPPPRRRACRALDLHRRTRPVAVLHRRPPGGPSRPRRRRGRRLSTFKGLQRLRNAGAASTASRVVPGPRATAPVPPFAANPHGAHRDLRLRPNSLKIQKETTHRHHSRKRRRPTPSNRARTASRGGGPAARRPVSAKWEPPAPRVMVVASY